MRAGESHRKRFGDAFLLLVATPRADGIDAAPVGLGCEYTGGMQNGIAFPSTLHARVTSSIRKENRGSREWLTFRVLLVMRLSMAIASAVGQQPVEEVRAEESLAAPGATTRAGVQVIALRARQPPSGHPSELT